jgi:hypothetical protein
MKDLNKDIEIASSGTEDDLRVLAYHSSFEVVGAILKNKNLTEDIALIVANRKNVGSEILESLFHDTRWKDNYRIMLALCKNPKTPQKISLSLIKSLKIFDLADLSRNQFIPANMRIKAEAVINEKIPSIPLGIKIALTKRAGSGVLMKLIEEGKKQVVTACLDSPYITESVIYKIISKKTVPPKIIWQIADHPKWSCLYQIQWALVLNIHTPLPRVLSFLKNIKSSDLRDLYEAPETPSSTKPFIYSELLERDKSY